MYIELCFIVRLFFTVVSYNTYVIYFYFYYYYLLSIEIVVQRGAVKCLEKKSKYCSISSPSNSNPFPSKYSSNKCLR